MVRFCRFVMVHFCRIETIIICLCSKLRYLNEELPKYGENVVFVYGGGSVCDYAKALSVSVHCDEDPWEKYYLKFEEPDCEIVEIFRSSL